MTEYKTAFHCAFCDALVPFAMMDAIRHVNIHSRRCPICTDQLAMEEIENERHLRRIHRVGAQIPTRSTNFFHTCSICRAHIPVFPRDSHLYEDNAIFVRRHYLEHFENNNLRQEYWDTQEQYFCPYPTCFKAFHHRSSIYTCFFIHPSEDLPMSEGNPTVGTQAGEVHSQVCSPPPATNMIGNPMHSSTQADLPSNPDPVSSSPGDAPQPDYTGA